MNPRRVLLVEDDPQMAELLKLLITVAAPEVEVDWCTDVASAELTFSAQRHSLVLCDWNLPGRPGIDLLPTLRRQTPRVPVLMITGRADRNSVIVARARGADGFIVKPFQAERVVARLQPLLSGSAPAAEAEAAAELASSLSETLANLDDAALEPPALAGLKAALGSVGGEELPDLRELAARWEQQPVLIARLVAMANSSAYNPKGQLCASLIDSLQRLGPRIALNVAAALTLREAGEVADPRLAALIAQQLDNADQVAALAIEVAQQCGVDAALCQTAALLHRLGELCVLLKVDQWQQRQQQMAELGEVEQALRRHSEDFAARLLGRWRYPAWLRQLIAAVRELPGGAIRREQYVLRIAGGGVYGDLDPAEEARLFRLAQG